MAWTLMQEKAIFTRGKNMIVSAGAGSGKTAVLSERILELCKSGVDIRNILVLTFTNAAASEMKERIRKKLTDNHLQEQADLVDSAAITTFDAYSLSLVKKYYYVLGIDKNITIIDQSLLAVQKNKFVEELFQELYQNKNEAFFNLLKKYAKQNDDNVKKMVLSILDKLELQVDVEKYLNTYQETYGSAEAIHQAAMDYDHLVAHKVEKFVDELETLEALCDTVVDEKLMIAVEGIMEQLHHLSGYDDYVAYLSGLSLPRVSPKASQEVKNQKKRCADYLKKLIETYFSKYSSLALAETELIQLQPEVHTILSLVVTLQERMNEYKSNLQAYDYMDIAKMAISLVTKYPNIHDEVSQGFTEILIDEYQDTSDVQEAFIQAIVRSNCMMVGDLKQSIYRFRNANPYIFKSKYANYSQGLDGIKIDLTHNFRSRREVIEDINELFSFLMTNIHGDVNYSLDHQMRYGQKNYELLDQPYHFHTEILSYDPVDHFTDEEVEAFICGKKIIELLKQAPQCLEKDTYRPVTYSDIAILIDKTKSFVTFKKIFEYLGIPLSIEADLDLNNSILPKLFANILLMLSKRTQGIMDKAYDHALCSIGRSFLFRYDDNTLYLMVHDHLENELTQKITALVEQFQQLSMEELFYRMVDDFEIYEKLPLIGDVNNSCVVLEYIYSLFQTMKQARMDIVAASDYFNSVFEEGIGLKYKLPTSGFDSVHIMTIHKSKGLEFAYCFFPMLASKFNQVDIKMTYGLSEKYGIYLPYTDEASSPTILKALVDEQTKTADLSEKIRLFYVALTRAREKIFLISKNEEYDSEIEDAKSINQLVLSARFLMPRRQFVDFNELHMTKDYLIVKKPEALPQGEKISYSEERFESQSILKKHISKELTELINPDLERAIELGKTIHECLEVLDLANPDIDGLPVEPFIKSTLKQILKHPVFKNISLGKTYHEYEFYFAEFHGIIDLLVVYSDHIDIIDYKLSSVDSEEYVRQLTIYKQYVETISNLPIHCYLLSILKKELKRIL